MSNIEPTGPITQIKDLTEEVVDRAVELAQEYYPNERVDWNDIIPALEREMDIEIPYPYDTPAARKIIREVRKRK